MDIGNAKWKLGKGWKLTVNPIKSYLKSPTERRNCRYAKYYKHSCIKKKVILYESFYGRGMLCGPYALFQALIKDERYRNFHHVWVLDELELHTDLMKKWKSKYSNISFIQYGSKKYLKMLTRAEYLINNSTFSDYFIKKPGQTYINTWHGIPLKSLGYDEPAGPFAASNTVRNFLHVDYLISANPFLTEIYQNAYKQLGNANLKIIEEGYPRLDTLVNTDKNEIYDELEKSGVKVDRNKKIILYAPTWKGSSFGNPDLAVDGFVNLKEKLEAAIDTNKYQIFVKVHQAVYSRIRNQLKDYDYVVPATMDANVILGITDILVSDYSSIYFDYLATGRPLLFYIPDVKNYSETRGMYFTVEDLPGPYTESLDTLGDWINNIEQVFEENRGKYDRVKDWCCNYDIGNISKKVVDAIFGGKEDGVKIVSCKTKKKKVLFSRGPMLVNGITTAFLNVLNQIDYDKYDVTVLLDGTKDAAQKEKIMSVNSQARVLVRPGGARKTLKEAILNNYYTQCGPRSSFIKKIFPKGVYKREFCRILGESRFDYIIDYEGYNIFFSTLCLMQPEARTCIWLHNDMVSEYNVRFKWLKKIFAIYPQFDRIVSCSEQIMEVNRQNFADKVSKDKFYFAKNCVNFGQVLAGMEQGQILKAQDKHYYMVPSAGKRIVTEKLIPLQPELFERLENGKIEICNSKSVKIEDGITRFVSMGRLSPEKNQEVLIQAFARLVEDGYDAMLFILGEGPLHKKLTALIESLNLSERVMLTGNLSNPFGLMKLCDCFILPSIHEGQPLVIHEARLVHLPIIVSNFSSVGGSLVENGQYRIENDEEAVYEGLKAYFAGKVPAEYKFDYIKYNKEAYQEFEAAVFGK